MSVVGIDIGNVNCFVAVAKAGGIETVANEYSDRCSPAIVAFNDVQRLVGISAKNQMVMNFRSTVTQFKRLIGRKFDEVEVQEELKRHNISYVRLDNGDIGIQVLYRGETTTFKPEQIMAMLLTELKNTAQVNLQTKVTDCVVSVPSYYTDYQRRCLLQAINISGTKCLKLMNDTSAVALNYGLFKQDLPAAEEKPRNVAFVDCGHSSLQVCIASFNKGKIKIKSTASDISFGGRDFDDRLKNYFADAFLEKYKIDARSSPKAWMRLGTEVEKIKKQMSSNTTDLPLNIECFMEDKDVSHKLNRAAFEEMCHDLLDRVEAPLRRAIDESGLKVEEIDVVELVGGSSRIPAIKLIVEKTFNKPISTTLNLDEAVARGCAIQCAMLSHTVKVRDIEVTDATPYPVNISWDSVKPDENPGEMVIFSKHHAYPFTKMMTFPHRVQPFCFKAYYSEDAGVKHFEREIGNFVINAVPASESCEKVKVKVKLRLDINGCFAVSSATQVETLPPPPEKEVEAQPAGDKEEPMDVSEQVNSESKEATNESKPKEEENQSSESQGKESEKVDGNNAKKEEKKEEAKPESKKPKKSSKNTELTVVSHQAGPLESELNTLVEIENELIATVRHEKERSDAKNSVEEYIYNMREKIYSDYEKYISEADRETLSSLLSQTEDWLYEDGANLQKHAYVEKLAELKKLGQPVADRYKCHQGLPAAFEAFGSAITHYRKILDLYTKKDEKYVHLDESDMKKVGKKLEEKQQWFNQKMQENGKCPTYVTPSVFPSQVATEKKLLEDFCNPIVNKPKPKAEPPKDDKKASKDASKEEKTENQKDKAESKEGCGETSSEKMETEDSGGAKNNLDMEVD